MSLVSRVAGLLLAVLVLLLPVPAHAAPSISNPEEPLVEDWEPTDVPADWIEVSSAAVHVHGHPDDVAILERLLAHADAALPRLAGALAVPLGSDVHLLLAHTADQFRGLQPHAPPAWADATAWPSIGAVYLRHPSLRGGDPEPLEQVLDHELVHVLLGRAFHPLPVPRWLQEGTAQVYAGQAGPALAARIQRGALGPGLFSLAELERGFPAHAGRADLAYAQSADFVQWLRAGYGEDAVQRLVRLTREGRSLDHAVRKVTGMPLAEVDAAWRSRLVATTAVWTSPERLEALLWGGAGVGILVVGFARRRAVARRLGSWRTRDAELERLARQVLQARWMRDTGA